MDNTVEKAEAHLRRRVHDHINSLVTDARFRGNTAILCEMIMEAAKTAIAAAVAAERARVVKALERLSCNPPCQNSERTKGWAKGVGDARVAIVPTPAATPPSPTPVAATPADEARLCDNPACDGPGACAPDCGRAMPDMPPIPATPADEAAEMQLNKVMALYKAAAGVSEVTRAVIAYGDARAALNKEN